MAASSSGTKSLNRSVCLTLNILLTDTPVSTNRINSNYIIENIKKIIQMFKNNL